MNKSNFDLGLIFVFQKFSQFKSFKIVFKPSILTSLCNLGPMLLIAYTK